MKRIAAIGANGQLGSRLVERLGERAIPVTRVQMDLESGAAIIAWLDAEKPAAIINAAAYTNVEKAEDETALAHRINADGPARMAAWAAEHAIPFFHISTDYVFDGSKGSPYREGDAPHALNAYGASKEAGEKAVLAAYPHAHIFRVSWLYDARGKNFFTTIARKLLAGDALRVVDDQHGTPCYAPDISQALVTLLDNACPPGIFHLVQQGSTSWFGFACAIRQALEKKTGKRFAAIEPVAASQYPTKAKRPADSRLDASTLYSVAGLRLPAWEEAVERAAKEYHED